MDYLLFLFESFDTIHCLQFPSQLHKKVSNPQHRQMNWSGGSWYEMRVVKSVSVKVSPVYSGLSLRPDKFEVVYKIEGQEIEFKTIRNQAGG